MKTDLPLKRLTRLRPQDVLALLGSPNADVLEVETLELPASKTSLDNVLRVRRPDGQEYLHLIEWQGWHDEQFLWRVFGYLAWLGQNRPVRPILATLIYLTPDADVGDTVAQTLDGAGGWQVMLPCVRLWEEDAQSALASGLPGLLALAPLMGGATTATVEQAAQRLISEVDQPAQGELLAALGVFAEPMIDAQRFIRMVTKERLMSSDLISYLFQDVIQEKEAEFERKEAALMEREAVLVQALQQTVEDALATRFPTAPISLVQRIRARREPGQLLALHHAVLSAPDLATVEQLLESGNGS